MKGSRDSVFIGILVAIALPVAACLWDHDTLRAEAKGLPGLAAIIMGRFERNPPLYYEMRLDRSSMQIAEQAQNWEAYDNAAVACDRLGRHDEAIEWMQRKRGAMEAHRDAAELGEHQYRYIANLGTFHAHRWFARGADRSDMTDMERAEELIAAAIELNPDAHFGRESYQLMAMRWILNPPPASIDRDGTVYDLPPILLGDEGFRKLRENEGERFFGELARAGLDDAVQGLSGLIALGNAWESVDVFHALAIALNDQRNSAMAYLARLRCLELIRAGRNSLHPSAPAGEDLAGLVSVRGYMTTEEEAIDAYFPKARAAADRWHEERTLFMIAKLQTGLHPDTDPSFWDGYVELEAVALPNGLLGLGSHRAQTAFYVAGISSGALVLSVGVIWLMRRSRRMRGLRIAAAQA